MLEQTGAEAGAEQLRVGETAGASVLGPSSPAQGLMGPLGDLWSILESRALRYAESRRKARARLGWDQGN